MLSTKHLWSSRFAWLMAAIALLPISVGAVVTTVQAGMAFADWPTSDGHGMLAYPWLQSSGAQFLEHGHRLAGMLIGIVSLLFTGWAWLVDHRPAIRWLSLVVLLGVIGQGILGGIRVRMDDPRLALVHGQFAAWVFTAMCITALMAANTDTSLSDPRRPSNGLTISAVVAFIALIVQSLLGGRLRHLGSSDAWLVHPYFAVVVVAGVLLVFALAGRQELPRLQTTCQIALWLVFAQAALGLFTWGAKFGYPQWNILAERGSPAQLSLSSLHAILGLLTFAAVGLMFVQTIAGRRYPVGHVSNVPDNIARGTLGNVPHVAGGAA